MCARCILKPFLSGRDSPTVTRVVLGRNRMEIGMLASCHVARALRCKLQCACYDLRTPVPCTVDALVYFIWYVKHRFRLCSLGNLRCVRVRSGSRVSPLPSGRELKILQTRDRDTTRSVHARASACDGLGTARAVRSRKRRVAALHFLLRAHVNGNPQPRTIDVHPMYTEKGSTSPGSSMDSRPALVATGNGGARRPWHR